MSVSASIPTTVQIRRSRLLGLIGVVAALAAAVTWAILAVAFPGDGGGPVSGSTPTASPAAQQAVAIEWARGYGNSGVRFTTSTSLRRDPSIMSRTPAQLAAGPALESVLASMSHQTRRYTRAVMNLTFAQLAAGAAGHP